jgi:hypothetical protein
MSGALTRSGRISFTVIDLSCDMFARDDQALRPVTERSCILLGSDIGHQSKSYGNLRRVCMGYGIYL